MNTERNDEIFKTKNYNLLPKTNFHTALYALSYNIIVNPVHAFARRRRYKRRRVCTDYRGIAGFLCLFICCLCIGAALGNYETSWHFYNEEQCCTGEKNSNKKDFVSEFSCGEMFYRTLHLDDPNGFLYVGGMDHVYRLQMSDINKSDCKRDSLYLEATDVTECIISGKSEEFECRNHVRVIEDIGDNMLYICGTNAYNPRDLIIYKDLKHLPRHIHRARVGRGAGRCAPSPSARTGALLRGALHAASRAGADPLYARWDLGNDTTHHGYLRTLKYDTKWMDNPEFISIQPFGDYIYLLMRERDPCNFSSDLYSSERQSGISVAARVCSGDKGGSRDKRHWTTYAKARITCSTPHYDQLESVYRVPDDSTRLYGIFTSGFGSVMKGSVICSFSSSSLDRPFRGPFSEWTSGGRSRYPVPDDRIPNPRPGTCVKDTTKLPDSVVNFLRSHPMMFESILPEFDGPIFIQKDAIFSVLAVDKIVNNLNNYTIFYAGTNDGRIFKIVQWISDGRSDSFLQDIWKVLEDRESVVAMVLSRTRGSLYVASDRRVVQIAFGDLCRQQYDGCVRCARDPYCGWSGEENACKPYEIGLFQDVADTSVTGCDELVRPKRVLATFGQSVHLGNFLSLPEVMKDRDFTWSRYGSDRGKKQIIKRSSKYILTAGRGLVAIGLTHQDGGMFECRQGKRLIALYNVVIDSNSFMTNRCSPPSQNGSYHRIYLDWCREFMKHKEAMNKWQSRTKQQCKKFQLDWHNLRSNEVIQNH